MIRKENFSFVRLLNVTLACGLRIYVQYSTVPIILRFAKTYIYVNQSSGCYASRRTPIRSSLRFLGKVAAYDTVWSTSVVVLALMGFSAYFEGAMISCYANGMDE